VVWGNGRYRGPQVQTVVAVRWLVAQLCRWSHIYLHVTRSRDRMAQALTRGQNACNGRVYFVRSAEYEPG